MMRAHCMSRVWRAPARLIILFGLLLNPLLVSALDVPPLTGRVVDLARVLSGQDTEQLSDQPQAHERNRQSGCGAGSFLHSMRATEAYSHRVAYLKLGQKGT
jgi:uncharacterized protein